MICIKGMKELPETCDDCIFYFYNNDGADTCNASEDYLEIPIDRRHEKCPLVEVNVIDELKDIKKDLKDESYPLRNDDDDHFAYNDRVIDLDDVNSIIDDYIDELKGELER